jgi:TonB-dependent receptor
MFPTGILENIKIAKSTSAQYSGEFGGGHILLNTTSIPEDSFLKISLGISKSSGGAEGYTYAGGKKDWQGIDDGTRSLPTIVKAVTMDGRELTEETLTNPEGFNQDELEVLGEAFNNSYNIKKEKLPMNKGFSIAAGGSADIGKNKFGLVGSFLYGDEWQVQTKRKAKYQAPEFTKDPSYTATETERLVKLGSALSLGWDWGKAHSIRTFQSILRRTTDETLFSEGSNQEWDGPFQSTSLKWQEREMILSQYWGQHTLPAGMLFDWRFGKANATMYQPDTSEYRYEFNNDRWEFSSRRGGNKRNFSELTDENSEWGSDLTIPFKVSDVESKFKLGFHKVSRSRESETRRYGFGLKGSLPADLLNQDPESIFHPDHIGPDAFVIKELTLASDSYEGEQTISSHYFQMDSSFSGRLMINAGVRVEESEQRVRTFNLHDADNNAAIAQLNQKDSLPSSNLTWKFDEHHQLRFSYNTSLARPDFRELSPTPYIDDETGDEIIGNPDLKVTEIEAYDTRYEWYGDANESFSVALFYKKFNHPIEVSLVSGTNQLRYDTAESASTKGIEVEWLKNISSDLKFGGNVAYMQSLVKLADSQKGVQTNNERPLQGQSPYALNLFFFYDIPATRSHLSLLFNQMGPRIASVGEIPFDDTYEMPSPQLDFVYSQELGKHFQVRIKATNLLSSNQKFEQEGRETSFTEKDSEYSLQISARF